MTRALLAAALLLVPVMAQAGPDVELWSCMDSGDTFKLEITGHMSDAPSARAEFAGKWGTARLLGMDTFAAEGALPGKGRVRHDVAPWVENACQPLNKRAEFRRACYSGAIEGHQCFE